MSKLKVDMSSLIPEVYLKIANWHNGDEENPTKESLKVLSQEIIQDILMHAFKELKGAKTTIKIEVDEAKAFEEINKSYEKFKKEHGDS